MSQSQLVDLLKSLRLKKHLFCSFHENPSKPEKRKFAIDLEKKSIFILF